MDETASIPSMGEQDRRISEVVEAQRSRLGDFVRRRVPDPSDVEDIVQEVFSELVEANRLLMPIEHVVGWLFRVARNRIIDLLRKRGRQLSAGDRGTGWDDGDVLLLEEVLPSPEAGPEEIYARVVLAEALEEALDELPEAQREVFLAHEIEGESFQEIAARTGVNVNTLLSRKRYAVLHLRDRLREMYDELTKG